MAKFDIKLDTQREAKRVRALPELVVRYLFAAFLRAAASINSAAEARAPRGKTGQLAASLGVKANYKGTSAQVTVGALSGGGAYYAPWVESGHAVGQRGQRNLARLHRRLGITGSQRVPAHPFFFPAVAQLRSSFSADFDEAISRAEKETQGS